MQIYGRIQVVRNRISDILSHFHAPKKQNQEEEMGT